MRALPALDDDELLDSELEEDSELDDLTAVTAFAVTFTAVSTALPPTAPVTPATTSLAMSWKNLGCATVPSPRTSALGELGAADSVDDDDVVVVAGAALATAWPPTTAATAATAVATAVILIREFMVGPLLLVEWFSHNTFREVDPCADAGPVCERLRTRARVRTTIDAAIRVVRLVWDGDREPREGRVH
ncbi:hypothetical protein GCM10007298_12500 [Williamsia phyllosphaerae]|uniref:Uncharacterized protein n=1 Tax=Williamsia phyllosphaerae TaxID=885042 RepID=A0ABQ1UFM8_9NOCA|nr:hypothetical protein GCM10007298_12500 [Williamsia phyllosphaerae]